MVCHASYPSSKEISRKVKCVAASLAMADRMMRCTSSCEYEKRRLVRKLREARERTGKLGGRKSYAEAMPETVALAKQLHADGLSYRGACSIASDHDITLAGSALDIALSTCSERDRLRIQERAMMEFFKSNISLALQVFIIIFSYGIVASIVSTAFPQIPRWFYYVGIVVWVITFEHLRDNYEPRILAMIEYSVPWDRIASIPPQPTDCDFMTAPMGEKGCFYKVRTHLKTEEYDNDRVKTIAPSVWFEWERNVR